VVDPNEGQGRSGSAWSGCPISTQMRITAHSMSIWLWAARRLENVATHRRGRRRSENTHEALFPSGAVAGNAEASAIGALLLRG
jgi:hypothetical protein